MIAIVCCSCDLGRRVVGGGHVGIEMAGGAIVEQGHELSTTSHSGARTMRVAVRTAGTGLWLLRSPTWRRNFKQSQRSDALHVPASKGNLPTIATASKQCQT